MVDAIRISEDRYLLARTSLMVRIKNFFLLFLQLAFDEVIRMRWLVSIDSQS